ncbi:hypothetical protein PDJAM_G00033670 [Pangasius djambal]|uniref:Uncharacterized protein n=1 Tax=Pangasius djambal TaxID=1691987 RepID=A0ACC5YRU3_9TELE|nr:hypothetical protein [Pangasius djambal]
MSLGLSMTKDPQSSKLLVCGPTIPKDCKQFTAYNGMCFTLDSNNNPSGPIPSTLRDCPPPSQTDIAFLLDGSGSVSDWDFTTMKNFVISMVDGLKDRDFQFAVAQYSSKCEIHIKFNSFSSTNQIHWISQFKSGTYTASAIKKVVSELFTSEAGARENANRVLVVITDGESHDRNELGTAARNAEQKKITRYAIGVGSAFNNPAAANELKTIASAPDNKHVFKVNDFSVLKEIQDTLEENIIAIEGTQTSGESTRMEFAQDGFSADFVSNGNIIMSAVGAFQWKGGYQKYDNRGAPLDSFQKGNSNDSYLGYSMTVARTSRELYYIIQGAPRDKHMGKVTISSNGVIQTLDPPELQIGAYYGAELCVVDLDLNSFADLLLVSAPLHNEGDQEGKVFIYTFTTSVSQVKHIQSVKGIPGQRGRFGLTLASPADLNGDSLVDIVIGAPLEEKGQGSIYIFNGRKEDIAPTFSQRITGSSVRTGLQFFGFSLSQSALDQSGDRLPDLAVGSKGTVILLRSRPIVKLWNTVTYTPSKIPTRDTDCTIPLKNTLNLCFYMRGSCPNDALNPLSNELVYTFEGLPAKTLNNLRPMLLPTTKTTSDTSLDFEINCGTDNICVDNLKVDFNFSGYSVIQVGIMQDMNVTVSVENRGENSYNSRVILKYPFGLSFRRVTTKQASVSRKKIYILGHIQS